MENFVWLVPFFPLVSFVIIGLLGKKMSKNLVSALACGSILASFFVSVALFFGQLHAEHGSTVTLFQWIKAGDFAVNFSFLIDPLSSIFLLVITGIGFLIHWYSVSYMHDDDGFARFFAYLNLFVFFMLLLVLGDNYLVMFVGWEGVGLCSYLLIGFWFKNIDYSNAAKKAFIMNRIGDLGYLLGIFLIFTTFGSVTYSEVFSKISPLSDSTTLTAIALLLFVGAMGKSAQIPLYTWLPDAMAGPTPVSALIHAATMVTAGIYMIARSNAIFSLSPTAQIVVAAVGIATALVAATIALFQTDIKKVLAYSTVSQLGLMFVALGVGAYTAAVFHVVTHAFFKALLFLGAGSVIHAMSGEQDVRNMGGLKKYLPVTYTTFFIGTLAISGIPPFAGFFSKDEILAAAFEHQPILWVLGLLVSAMTCFYMFRLFFLTFYGNFRGTHEQEHHLHESPPAMTIPLIILAALSIAGGFLGFPHELGELLGIHHGLSHFLASVLHESAAHASLSTELLLMSVAIAMVAIVTFIAYQVYVKRQSLPVAEGAPMSAGKKLAYNKYYIDEIYNSLITKPLQVISEISSEILDKKIVDGSVNGIGKIVKWSSIQSKNIQTGNLGFYVFAMVAGLLVMFVLNWLF